MLTLLLIAACTVSEDVPATPGSPAAQEVATITQIAQDAQEISRLAAELTARIDESRRQVADGRSSRDAEIARMREMMAQITQKNTALQQKAQDLQERLHTEAGDPAWPPLDP